MSAAHCNCGEQFRNDNRHLPNCPMGMALAKDDKQAEAKELAGHLFQSMDRVHVTEGTFVQFIYQSQGIQAIPELLEKADKIVEALAELYQAVGKAWNEAEEAADDK